MPSLLQTTALLEELFDASPVPSFMVDDDVRVLMVNRAGRVLLGLGDGAAAPLLRRAGEVLGCIQADGPGGCGRQEACGSCMVRSAVARALTRGPVRGNRVQLELHAGQDAVLVNLLVGATEVRAGGAGQVLLTLEDVTDAARTREELEATRAALARAQLASRAALAVGLDALLVSRLDGTIVAVNEGFTRATGWTEADLLGRSELERGLWAVPGDRAAVIEALHARRPVEEQEVALRSRDGRTLTGLLTANPINLGGAACLVALFRDISERTAARLAG